MLRLGIIGAGPNGTGNARKFAQHFSRCTITAIADPRDNEHNWLTLACQDRATGTIEGRGMVLMANYCRGWLCVELDKKFAGAAPRTPLHSARMCRRYLQRHGW